MYYFGVQDEQRVPSYMFVDKPTMTSSKRKTRDVFFNLTAFGENFIFELRVNTKILSNDCVLQQFNINGVVTYSPCHDHYRPCNYLGQSQIRSDHWAAVSYCDVLVGVISTSSHDFTILPLKASHFHLLHSLNWTTPFGSTYIINKLTRKTPGDNTNRARTRPDIPVTVEIVTGPQLVANHSNDVSLYGLNLTSFITINMNIVFSLFHDKTLWYHLTPTISRITVLSNPQFLKAATSDAQILENFADWYSITYPLYRADLSILVIGKNDVVNTERTEYDINGFAYTEGMCHEKYGKCIMVKDMGLGTAFTIAHEIGHTLKMKHDNEFTECQDSGNIMQKFATYGESSFHWSNCSDRAMTKFFESDDSTCLKNKTRPPPNNKTLPGCLYDEEAQCKLTFGQNFWPNKYRTGDKCGKLSCCYNQRHCINIGYPLVDGTECGNRTRTWCIKGRCVDIGPDGPPPVHGGWSTWGVWSICSRTAGGGVRWRKRLCNNPKPRYSGESCHGNWSEVRLCNIQPYGLSDAEYKMQQRRQNQAVIGRHPCTMTRTVDNITTWPPYIDGSNCINRDPNHISKCYEGRCKNFGCDGFLGSPATFDVCGVCNGKATRCRPVNKVLDLKPNNHSKDKAVSFRIPANSTGILIRNNNRHIVKLDSTQLPIGDYYYDRYDIVLKRYSNATEDIQIVGPLKQDFEFKIKIIVQNVNALYNLTVNYKYYIPLDFPRFHRYVWKSIWSPCSVTCGTGYSSLEHKCIDRQLQEAVDDTNCEAKEYPADNRTTCVMKECSVGWYTSAWSPCSKTCGESTSNRTVKCVNNATDCEQGGCTPRPSYECRHLLPKPNQTRACHDQPCPPVWVITHVSNCSEPCGIGMVTRTIKCVDGENDSIVYNDALCESADRPAENFACCNKYCRESNDIYNPTCADDEWFCSYFNSSDCRNEIIRNTCPETCGICTGCVDKVPVHYCQSVGRDDCARYRQWAWAKCPKTCGLCVAKVTCGPD
ncbi:A disintegrin and metalloproteinase with thrombospondin motifs 18-like [Argopecten irradians]|uniref:A disintegrin and metalloproteinase with thrombospondin motifs 18-like n=1 Tax=Argopecten irradians TaxID=31199 RepID=UPI00370FD571